MWLQVFVLFFLPAVCCAGERPSPAGEIRDPSGAAVTGGGIARKTFLPMTWHVDKSSSRTHPSNTSSGSSASCSDSLVVGSLLPPVARSGPVGNTPRACSAPCARASAVEQRYLARQRELGKGEGLPLASEAANPGQCGFPSVAVLLETVAWHSQRGDALPASCRASRGDELPRSHGEPLPARNPLTRAPRGRLQAAGR